MTEAYEDARREGRLGWDPDHYVFLHIPKSHRKVWQLMRHLAHEVDWLDLWEGSSVVRFSPSAGEYTPAYAAAVRVLNDDGIRAYLTESFR